MNDDGDDLIGVIDGLECFDAVDAFEIGVIHVESEMKIAITIRNRVKNERKKARARTRIERNEPQKNGKSKKNNKNNYLIHALPISHSCHYYCVCSCVCVCEHFDESDSQRASKDLLLCMSMQKKNVETNKRTSKRMSSAH